MIRKRHANAFDYQKPQWLSMLVEVLTWEQLRSLGWKITKKSYERALHHAQTKGPGAPVDGPKLPPSKQPKSPEVVAKIISFLNENSKPCPNRFVKIKTRSGKKLPIAVRELEGFKN